jgi:hypothetical protein
MIVSNALININYKIFDSFRYRQDFTLGWPHPVIFISEAKGLTPLRFFRKNFHLPYIYSVLHFTKLK